MKWFYVQNGAQAGPVEEDQLDELVRTQVIGAETLVWKEGMANWEPYRVARSGPPAFPNLAAGAVPASAAAAAAPAPAYQGIPTAGGRQCAQCGLVFPDTEVVQLAGAYVCAGCKPVALQRMREGSWSTGSRKFAGFWIRVAASLIDSVIAGVAALLLLIPLGLGAAGASLTDSPEALVGGIFGIFALLLGAAAIGYQVFFLVKYGATPGKLVLGLKVIRPDGGGLSVGRALGRVFANSLSGMILYIGYIMVAFDGEKRALHDHICDTRVVYKS